MVDKLTDQEIAEYKEAFNLFDTSKNGWIPSENLGALMRSVGHAPTSEDLLEMQRKTDKRGKGKVDFPEFITLLILGQNDKNVIDKPIKDMFAMYVDDRGYLSVQTIRNLLQNMGDCLADDELNDLLRDLKVEQQGKVKYEDLMTVLFS